MGQLLASIFGWSDFLTLAFFGKTALVIVAAVGIVIVARAALRSKRRWWILLVVVLPVYAVIGIVLAVAFKIL